jgi:hypothetical protein
MMTRPEIVKKQLDELEAALNAQGIAYKRFENCFCIPKQPSDYITSYVRCTIEFKRKKLNFCQAEQLDKPYYVTEMFGSGNLVRTTRCTHLASAVKRVTELLAKIEEEKNIVLAWNTHYKNISGLLANLASTAPAVRLAAMGWVAEYIPGSVFRIANRYGDLKVSKAIPGRQLNPEITVQFPFVADRTLCRTVEGLVHIENVQSLDELTFVLLEFHTLAGICDEMLTVARMPVLVQ